jgi:hypothetical protein
MSKKFLDYIQTEEELTPYEDRLEAYARITLPLEKEASSAMYIVPTALGLGAAGTAAYIGSKDATSNAKLKVLRKVRDPDKRREAEAEVEASKYRKAAPAALGAGLGAMWLGGSHAAEDAIKDKGSIKKMKGKRKLLHAPGTYVQQKLRRLGATSATGKGIAGAAVLGAGALAGKIMGDRIGDRAIRNVGIDPDKTRDIKTRAEKYMSKDAGLFLKPSDLADNHHDLSAALENKLNSVDDGRQFKKQANSKVSMGVGAAVGFAYEPVRQVMSKPVPVPPPQKPGGGLGNRVRHSVARQRYETDKWKREHPVTATLISAGVGAGVGKLTNVGHNISELHKSIKGKV